MSYIKLIDREVFYRIEGDGEPLILLHNGFYSSATWNDIIPSLSKKYKVISYDRFGYGASSKLTKMHDDIVLDGVAELSELIDALNLDKVNLLGHCLGGAIALLYAEAHPERVDKIIAESVGYYSTDKLLFKTDWTFKPYSEIPDKLRQMLINMHDESNAENLWNLMRNYKNGYIMKSSYTIIENIKKIKNQVLIIMGDRDFYFDIDHILPAYKKMKNSQVAIIPNADHDVHTEKKEEFLFIINKFLDYPSINLAK